MDDEAVKTICMHVGNRFYDKVIRGEAAKNDIVAVEARAKLIAAARPQPSNHMLVHDKLEAGSLGDMIAEARHAYGQYLARLAALESGREIASELAG